MRTGGICSMSMKKYDQIHWNSQVVDSYNKPFNCIQSPREDGKTTSMIKKIKTAFDKYELPSLIMRSQIADITEQYIDDIADAWNMFHEDDEQIHFFYKKSSIDKGVVDIYLTLSDMKEHTNPFIRVAALNASMQRLKSGCKKFFLFWQDEYIINYRVGEKYINGYVWRFKELYNTYRRENPNMKVYFTGNVYTYYHPIHEWLGLDTNQISSGKLIVGDNYVYQNHRLTDELLEKVLKNPMYMNDKEYLAYAVYGEPINDQSIKIQSSLPKNYSMKYLFKIEQQWLAVYAGSNPKIDEPFYCERVDWNPEYQRLALCFDFSNLGNGSVIPSKDILMRLYPLKYAVMNRMITFKDINCSYLMEQIYSFI